MEHKLSQFQQFISYGVCLVALFTFQWLPAQPNFNMELLSNPTNPCTAGFNDVWGLTHTNGNNYAVLGTRCGTSIYDLSDPVNPVLIADIAGAPGIWRDMKNWGNYIYSIADQGTFGLQVIDMSDPTNIRSWQYNPVIGMDTLKKAHNLYIDGHGLVYVAGSNLNSGGVFILDATANDSVPPIIGLAAPVYAHDVYVNDARDLLITSDIYAGEFTLHELTRTVDTVTAEPISKASTAKDFTHNAWTTDDGNTLFTTDERGGAYVQSWNIADLFEIEHLDDYAPFSTLGSNVTPHNVHVKGDYLYISYYRDGIKIVDASRPGNLVEVASYDTDTGGGSGCWGAFPFFDDYILASDMTHGLFVLRSIPASAAFLEGTIRGSEDNLLQDAVIHVMTYDSIFEITNASGNYATSIVDQLSLPDTLQAPGGNTLQVTISKEGYLSVDTMVTFYLDSVLVLDVVLEAAMLPVELLRFEVKTGDCVNQLEWEVGTVIAHDHFEVQSSSDGLSFASIESVFPEAAVGNLYRFKEDPTYTRTYYRLKQVDLDGTTAYSPIVFSKSDCDDLNRTIFPNPAQNFIALSSYQDVRSISILGADGRSILHLDDPDQEINIRHLLPGVYFLQIMSKSSSRIEKFVKSE